MECLLICVCLGLNGLLVLPFPSRGLIFSLPLLLIFLFLNHSAFLPLTCVFSLLLHFSIFISYDFFPSFICCFFGNFRSFFQSSLSFSFSEPRVHHHHPLAKLLMSLLQIPSVFTDLCAKRKIPRPPPCQCSENQQLPLLNKVLVACKSMGKSPCSERWHVYVYVNV